MKYDAGKKEIVLNKKLSELDKFVIDFCRILRKYSDYVIISGYVSILLGRARATEDVDLYFEEIGFDKFADLYEELKKNRFWCLNADSLNEVYSYLKEGYAVRFARENTAIPNIEMKFPKREIDKETFDDFITVILPEEKLKISSLERQIAFKRYFLGSDKDMEDALHVEELFRENIDYAKINKFKSIIENARREKA